MLSRLFTFLKLSSLHQDLSRAGIHTLAHTAGCGIVKSCLRWEKQQEVSGQVSFLASEDSFGLLYVGDPLHDLQILSRAEPKQLLGAVHPLLAAAT